MTRKGEHHTELTKAKISLKLLGRRCCPRTEWGRGHEPWNKGLKGKGICKANSGSFKKGQTPINSNGGLKKCYDGYYISAGFHKKKYKNNEGKFVKILKYERLARVIYIKTYGDFDKNLIVYHKDGDIFNDEPTNLELITRGELLKRNLKQKAICIICKKEFIKTSGNNITCSLKCRRENERFLNKVYHSVHKEEISEYRSKWKKNKKIIRSELPQSL